MNDSRKPGDDIIDRYCPNLPGKEREEMRAQLYAFVRWQLRIAAREVQVEKVEKFDSSGGSGRLE